MENNCIIQRSLVHYCNLKEILKHKRLNTHVVFIYIHHSFVCNKSIGKEIYIHTAIVHTPHKVTIDRVLTQWINEIKEAMKRLLRGNFIAKHKYMDI